VAAARSTTPGITNGVSYWHASASNCCSIPIRPFSGNYRPTVGRPGTEYPVRGIGLRGASASCRVSSASSAPTIRRWRGGCSINPFTLQQKTLRGDGHRAGRKIGFADYLSGSRSGGRRICRSRPRIFVPRAACVFRADDAAIGGPAFRRSRSCSANSTAGGRPTTRRNVRLLGLCQRSRQGVFGRARRWLKMAHRRRIDLTRSWGGPQMHGPRRVGRLGRYFWRTDEYDALRLGPPDSSANLNWAQDGDRRARARRFIPSRSTMPKTCSGAGARPT